MADVVVIGAGMGGLGAALGLERAGHRVTVIEQDQPPPTTSGDDAFTSWERRNVPQFQQAHGFSARSRNLLLRHAPGVVERLEADGVASTNIFKMLAPPEMHRPEDDEFTGFMSRRPAFELAMRLEAEGRAGITFDTPTVAAGLVFAETGAAPTVVGLRLQDRRVLSADLVIDAGGRRSPVPAWLAEGGVQIPSDVQDCGVTYFTRYFRRQPDCPMPVQAIVAVRAEFENLMVIGFTGDHDTYAITLASASWDDELRDLRHAWAWDAVVASLPTAAPWTAPDTGVPLHNVSTMAGHRNVRRHLVVDGEPLVLGLLPVGDSLCTTNPAYGWGASMALSYAFAACEAFAPGNGDLRRLALDYDEAVATEADGVYQESAAMDRVRGYRWRGEPVPAEDEDEAERQSLIEESIVQGMLRDAVLGRAFLRRANLLDPPRGILDDPEVLERATAMRDKFRGRPQNSSGPTRDELVATIATGRPKAAET